MLKKTCVASLAVLIALAIATNADAKGAKTKSERGYYGGGQHSQSHGGHYVGGHGSSHKGGKYANPHYGRHKGAPPQSQ